MKITVYELLRNKVEKLEQMQYEVNNEPRP